MIDLKVDTKEIETRFKKYRENIPNIAKKIMALVFNKMRKDIRTNISANFKRRKGWLRTDLNYFAFNDFSGSIASYSSKGQGAHYASVVEDGTTITAKNDKYLVMYSGKDADDKPILKKVKSVTIPPRPYFRPVVEDYWGGGGTKAVKLMDEGLQKEINKYVEKKGGGLVFVEDNE
jgi:hypothetical protein